MGRQLMVTANGKPRFVVTKGVRLLEQEVRLGYWTHLEFDWTDAVRTACELSAEHALRHVVRSIDLFHVAIAIETASDAFLSFDQEQRLLAEAAGLSVLRLGSSD